MPLLPSNTTLTPEQFKALPWHKRIALLPKHDRSMVTNLAEVPRWVKTAFAMVEVLGKSKSEASRAVGRSKNSLYEWSKSPAVKKWRERLRVSADDSDNMARSLIQAQQTNFTLDYFMIMQAAIEQNDLVLAEKMLAKLMESGGVLARKQEFVQPTIVVQVAQGALEAPTIQSESRQIPSADYEIIEHDPNPPAGEG